MLWLTVTISSYFLFAIVAFGDKYLLKRLMPSPKVYAFYVGVFGIVALLLIPFGFSVPTPLVIFLAFSAGASHILGVLFYFNGLKRFDTSRVVSAIGGLAPLFTFGLTCLFLGEEATFSLKGIITFLLLTVGSVLISWEKEKKFTFGSFKYSALAAIFFSLYYVLSKLVYLEQPFISGFIWSRLGAFLLAVVLFFSKEVREELFVKKKSFNLKTWAVFLPVEAGAGGAFILQNWAIALAGIAYVALVSALGGIQYAFVLIFAILLSLKFPQILKEEISKKILFQKILAILIIGAGLVILAF